MLQEIEHLIIPVLKNLLINPNIVASEFESLYKIYRDLKVITNGSPKSEDQKQA